MNTSSSDRQSYKCDLCHFDSAYADSLKKHKRTHTEEKTFKCNLCDYASIGRSSLKTHLKNHAGEKKTNAITVILHALARVRLKYI